MIVDFDPDKDEANRVKHGVSLLYGGRIFEDLGLMILPTLRHGDDEDRFKAVGMVEGKLWTAVLVWRENMPRMISVRRSNAGEQRDYDRNSR